MSKRQVTWGETSAQALISAGADEEIPHFTEHSKRLAFISHKVFMKSFCRSEFPRNFVNLVLILVTVKDKLTDLRGS